MTFDLFFYAPKDRPKFTGEKLVESFTGRSNFSSEKTADGYGILYRNKSTGVYFQIFYGAGNPEDPEGKLRFPGLELTGLTAHINYARPTFFALESVPIIVEIADKLGFLIFDNQSTAVRKEPSRLTAEELFDSWVASNRWSVNVYRSKGGSLKFLPREKLDYAWNFLRSREELQKRVGDAIFVPTQLFLLETKSRSLVTCCSWFDYMTQAFPLVDMVIVGKTKRFGGFDQKGLANLSDIRRVFDTVASEQSDPLAYLLMKEKVGSELSRQLDKIPLANHKDFTGVPWDQVVDVPA